jgi:tetratricopeptide (TPR) repeat protein
MSTLDAARAAYKLGNFAQAIEACECGIEEARALPDNVQLCRLRILLSQCYWAQGNFREAQSLTEFPVPIASLDVEISVRLLNQRGFVFTQIGDFAQAKKAMKEAENLAQTALLDRLTAEVQINFANLHFYLGDYAALEAAGRLALAIAEREQIAPVVASACAAIGKSYMYRNREAEAISWFERALSIFAQEGSDYYATSMRSELGCCYLALHEDDKAMILFTEALNCSERAGGLASQHIDLANMGAIHLRRADYAAALSHFGKALEIARTLGDQISVGKWLHNIALTYSRMGDSLLAKNFELEAELVNQGVAMSRAAAR